MARINPFAPNEPVAPGMFVGRLPSPSYMPYQRETMARATMRMLLKAFLPHCFILPSATPLNSMKYIMGGREST